MGRPSRVIRVAAVSSCTSRSFLLQPMHCSPLYKSTVENSQKHSILLHQPLVPPALYQHCCCCYSQCTAVKSNTGLYSSCSFRLQPMHCSPLCCTLIHSGEKSKAPGSFLLQHRYMQCNSISCTPLYYIVIAAFHDWTGRTFLLASKKVECLLYVPNCRKLTHSLRGDSSS